jgi:hypothetical protein
MVSAVGMLFFFFVNFQFVIVDLDQEGRKINKFP